MSGLTVTEKEHWKKRIARRIDDQTALDEIEQQDSEVDNAVTLRKRPIVLG